MDRNMRKVTRVTLFRANQHMQNSRGRTNK